jgi:non-specific serine/threonine protein kinase
MIGASLTHYHITAKLGEGGMGEVYRATDTKLSREVAIKVLPSRISRDPQGLARFEREAKALAALNHPHIAGIYGFEADQQTHFLVLELVEGETLAERLRRGPLPTKEALTVARQIAEAIQEAHEKGIIHRDLKPANVKITPNGQVKVLDFGLVKIEQAIRGEAGAAPPASDPEVPTITAETTVPGAVMGTPAYMSPEQARGKAVDKRTDIWAFGCCLYECLTGKKPFAGQTATELIAEVLKSEPDWSQVPAATPREVLPLLRRCLEKDPARRLSSIGDIAITLEESSKWSVRSAAEAPAKRLRPAAVGVMILLFGAGVYFWMGWGRGRHLEVGSTVGPTNLVTSPNVPPVADEKSIAVLPFANLSTEKENEFFADGLHDDVITSLAKIRDLKVISRTSVLAYRDPASRNLKKIAADLGVATVLEGSVRRVGNKVHMNAQLIDARTDVHLWADTFDGDASDIFALQAKLAQQIATALKATLTTSERALIERRPTQNQEAYELYQRARTMQQEQGERGSPTDYERIIAVYDHAIGKDPSFALAYAQVAMLDALMYWFAFLDPSPARMERTKAAVDAAVRLAPDAPETHLAVGAYHYRILRDWNRALAEFRAAEPGLPNDAQLYFWLAITHRRLGKWTEALGYFERAVTLNPRDLASVRNLTQFLLAMRRFQPSRDATARSLEYFPAERELLLTSAQAQFALDGDRAALAKAIEALPPLPADPAGLGDKYLSALFRGDYAVADRVLVDPRLATLPETHDNVINDPVSLHRAMLAFVRGDAANATRFARQAITFYRSAHWNTRQKPWVQMRIAQAEAWAGLVEDSVRDAQAAFTDISAQDAYDTATLRRFLGSVYVALGRRAEALDCLREMMGPTWPSPSPNEIRNDPAWSRLKDDPRFEEILKSAKSL